MIERSETQTRRIKRTRWQMLAKQHCQTLVIDNSQSKIFQDHTKERRHSAAFFWGEFSRFFGSIGSREKRGSRDADFLT